MALFFVLALGAASLLTITNSRPIQAESSLFHSVRCLVRTVLLKECQPVQNPAPTPMPTPAPSTPPSSTAKPSTQSPSSPSSSTPQSSPGGASIAPGNTAPLEKIELPEEITAKYENIQPVTNVTSGARIQKSEYLAYFNTYSPYAVAGAQTMGSAEVPVQRSAEGWKLFGIAWYWWGIIGAGMILLLPSVRNVILRKFSTLSKR